MLLSLIGKILMNQEFREKIYHRYGKDFQDLPEVFNPQSAARWGKAYRWYLRGWLPKQKDAKIADLGCGYGRLLYFLKEQGYTNICGVDISSDQVAIARQVVSNVDEGDVLNWLKDRSDQFDLLIALDLIEHFTREEALQFLELCFKSLKNGGRLIMQTPNADSPFGLQHRYNDITHEWAYNVNQLSRLLRRVGFVNIEAREQGPVPWGYSFNSTLRWINWRIVRAGLQFWNLAEIGTSLSVLTRVFLIYGQVNKKGN